ncbi:exopolysaccharide biosynthesis polyprenyl glycosylphosphotransferase [Pseudoalteromonas haloplanktis]|uniref:Exopolysaccharide biosynthesis polyprenyl glycosylphosphotransferase n=1 Tax=Pseudoalteromonas haloplanktis TaxID=228 RepID=A0ABU1BI31_PSEHA|nr:exopolysaccharide biosynthesis polyprenyl glycosylphosphotransferase [Pseudoalteromonas haloplanktis]MDQ9094143.1 exopolysaccharide biosynthesis polyprenyl glycosylphosphotransferase [Pseudoalteromonas haloplanktis]
MTFKVKVKVQEGGSQQAESILNSLEGISIRESFRSKKVALTQKVIYVYCPTSCVEKIEQTIERHSFDIIINDYSIVDFTKKVVCHYQSDHLTSAQRKFLVNATECGAWVEPLINYLDDRLKYTEVSLLHSNYFLHHKAFSILSNKRTQIAKRVVDIVCALTLLCITLPISIITALLIKLESSGPVLYKQKRTGQYNKQFKVYKFRSMCVDAEKNGAQWASENDTRVTKVGKFIRQTRIDEIPQLINILQGNMSIVGPRPEREIFITELESKIPYYRFRHAVKPGVTGLAQVKYLYGASVEDAVWKHKYDIYYIKHHSSLLDLKILVLTVKTVLLGMGR